MEHLNQQGSSNIEENPRNSRDFAVQAQEIKESPSSEDPPEYSSSTSETKGLRKVIKNIGEALEAAFTNNVEITADDISKAINSTLVPNNDINY